MVKQAVIILMKPLLTRAWLGVIKEGHYAGRIPSGTNALTLPSVTCEGRSEYPWVAAARLCKEVWGLPIDIDRLVWLQTCEQPMDYASKHYELTSDQTQVYVYGYRCTDEEVALIDSKAESTYIYERGQWAACTSIFNKPLDTNQMTYQPLWLMKSWLWICQHALSLRYLFNRQLPDESKGGSCGG